jgi:hypothetical protein
MIICIYFVSLFDDYLRLFDWLFVDLDSQKGIHLALVGYQIGIQKISARCEHTTLLWVW